MNKTDTRQVIEALNRLLADSYTMSLKTQSYHWNVTGPMFTTLHNLFESMYSELAPAVDEIAERIRALGHPPPAVTPNSLTTRRSRKILECRKPRR